MPKEVVRDRGGVFDVSVGWSREAEYVQLGAVMRAPESSDAPQDLKQLVNTWGDAAVMTGLFATLGRHEINELIRVLRRARDAAYGRDE